jgi:DnaJ-class molecular chaperone
VIFSVDNHTNSHKSYSFSGDPIEIFENFFGTVNPFHIALDRDGKQIPMIDKIESDIHKDFIRKESLQGQDLFITVLCTLQELFQGSTKRITYARSTDAVTSFNKPYETTSEK